MELADSERLGVVLVEAILEEDDLGADLKRLSLGASFSSTSRDSS